MRNDYLLGLHGFSYGSERTMHNAGVALLKNGKVSYAIDEERFSRKKNEGRFPLESLKALYRDTDIDPQQVQAVAFPDLLPVWQLIIVLKYLVTTYRETGLFLGNYLRESLKRTLQLRRTLPPELRHAKKFFVEHHLCHAASAYYTCPWNEVTIISIDGMGDFSMSGLTAIGCEGKIKVLDRLNGFYSPGLFYMIITEILGFVSGRHEGKVTGLAAMGRICPELEKSFQHLINYDERKGDFFSRNIAFEINDYISKYWVNGYNPLIDTGSFEEITYLKNKRQQLGTFRKLLVGFDRKDVAFAAQARLEQVITSHVKRTIAKTGIRNLVLAGGVFANVKLNQRIRELDCLDQVYVYPAMSDSGLSVGAALFTYYMTQNNHWSPTDPPMVDLGTAFEDDVIKSLLDEKAVPYATPNQIERKIGEAIAEGKIVAHFHGKSEYGPRALGNRSILASPKDRKINDLLNRRLNRTEFMPFAPAVIRELAEKYFIGWKAEDHSARFMTMTYNVTEELERLAPAVVHVDRSARPQVVSVEEHPRFHGIIRSHYELTGIPVIINTSFNLHEEPIVNSPYDALKVIERNVVDVLVLNNYWIESSCFGKK